jgi:hypothetical protein
VDKRRHFDTGTVGGEGLLFWIRDDILTTALPNTGRWRGSSFSG